MLKPTNTLQDYCNAAAGETKRLGGLEVDDEFELGRLLYGQFARLGSLQYLVHLLGSAPIEVPIVRPIGHEATSLRRVSVSVHRRQPVLDRKLCDLSSMGCEHSVIHDK